MKTKSQNKKQNTGLMNRSEQLSTEQTSNNGGRHASVALPKLDYAKRHSNRQLPTEKLLDLLRSEAPRLFEIAEVIGEWVWVQFTDKQPRDITTQLSQFGFHWNNKRQAWQHPCGVFRKEPSAQDPREKYGSHFAADTKAA